MNQRTRERRCRADLGGVRQRSGRREACKTPGRIFDGLFGFVGQLGSCNDFRSYPALVPNKALGTLGRYGSSELRRGYAYSDELQRRVRASASLRQDKDSRMAQPSRLVHVGSTFLGFLIMASLH